jgi:hypothetical protein
MIVAFLTDRLGNQLFQYAAAKALAVRNNTIVKIDKRYYDDYAPAGFAYELDSFCVPQQFLGREEVKKYTWESDSILYRTIRKIYPKRTYFEKSFEYDKQFEYLTGTVYLRGFWQSYKYFAAIEDIIRQEFRFKTIVDHENDAFAKDILTSESVCLSIRRGDHVTNPKIGNTFGSCGPSYYKQGLNILEQGGKKLKLFIFSDDIEWCRKNLDFSHPMVFVQHNFSDSRYDYYLQLMSLCKHFIIPVSTFPWWGAWLSTYAEKTVISPKIWFNDPKINTQDLCPPDWIRI